MIIITLSNGKKVGNFDLPYALTFEDASVLPAISEVESVRLAVQPIRASVDEALRAVYNDISHMNTKAGDVILDFRLTRDILVEMEHWNKLHKNGEVDVVFISLPVMMAIRDATSLKDMIGMPFRVAMVYGISKLASIDNQCL